jgi:hypothetical protein
MPQITQAIIDSGALTAGTYYLMGNITMTAPFSSVSTGVIFDGNNNTITINNISGFTGLFSAAVTVRNLGILSPGSTLATNAGWFFATNIKGGSATNCYSTGAINGSNCGGIFGSDSSGTATYCHSTGDQGIPGSTFWCGGICGRYFLGNISYCYSTGRIAQSGGGIVGTQYLGGTITNCYSTGPIAYGSGGILGEASLGTAINCYSSGGQFQNYAGGIFGYGVGTAALKSVVATNCYSTGTIANYGGSIFGGDSGAYKTANNCGWNATWTDSTANVRLSGDPIESGTHIWISTVANTPYKLATITYVAPDPPIIILATAGNAQATLTWSAPINDGGSIITEYNITSTPVSTPVTWTSGPLSSTIQGLTNGQQYTFTITAKNSGGTGIGATTTVTPTISTTFTLASATLPYNGVKQYVTIQTTPVGATYTVTDTSAATVSGDYTVTCTANGAYSGTGTVAWKITRSTPQNVKWPTLASQLVYGQKLSSSILSGGSTEGTFSFFSPNTKPGAGTAQYVMKYVPSDTSYLTIAEADPHMISITSIKDVSYNIIWATAPQITYGPLLGNYTLNGGSATNQYDLTDISGKFTWGQPTFRPDATITDVSYSIIFTPDISNNYSAVQTDIYIKVNKGVGIVNLFDLSQVYTGNVLYATASTVPSGLIIDISYNGVHRTVGSYSVTGRINDTNYQGSSIGTLIINKATPTIKVSPSVTNITYGQSLISSNLTGGTADVSGTFTFTTPSTIPNAGAANQTVIFTPTDIANYNTATANILVTVDKVTPTITTPPSASSIAYNTIIASSDLSGGKASVNGLFAFITPSTIPTNIGTYTYNVIFTPTDTTNYNTVSTTVSVTVHRATPSIITPPSASSIKYGQALASSDLSGGIVSIDGSFAFVDSTIVPPKGTNNQTAIFTPTDSLHYTTSTGPVSVTVDALIPCFIAGTKILTSTGYKVVESLTATDSIQTSDGRSVTYKGYRTTIKATTLETAPYTIPANTFGPNSPSREITLSPRHAIQSAMGIWQIPTYAMKMFSGIKQSTIGEKIVYYHIELPNYFTDNIVLEGNIIVESYGANQTDGIKNVYTFNEPLNGFIRVSNRSTVKSHSMV